MYKVLIADDEIFVRTALQEMIDWNELDCRVVYCAKDGIDAWEYMSHNVVDIAVLDIRMPGLSGMQVCDMMRQEDMDIAVVILTAYSDFEFVREALRLNVCDFVMKSNFEIELPDAIRRGFRRRDSERRRMLSSDAIPQPNASYSDPVNQVIAYLRINYAKRISLNDLSELVHLNQSYLCRLYKKQTNYTILEDLTRYRLHQAKKLLREGATVKESALQCGFDSAAYFTNVFTKQEGISPSLYRIKKQDCNK